MMEPDVGASTCASGSQVCSGNIGTLMANDPKKARKRISSARESSVSFPV